MPINVNDLYQRVVYLVNDAQQGRIAPLKVNQLINTAQNNFYNELVRVFNDTRQITHHLNPFHKSTTVAIPASGDVPFPSGFPADYDIYTSLRIRFSVAQNNNKEVNNALRCGAVFQFEKTQSNVKYGVYENEVKFISSDKISGRLQSAMLTPNKYGPVFTMYADKFTFRPANIKLIALDYLRAPRKANWAYTIQGGVPVYDPINSVDLEWDETLLDDIALLCVKAYLSNVMQYQK